MHKFHTPRRNYRTTLVLAATGVILGSAVSSFARDRAAEDAARPVANCFAACNSDECLRACIGRLALPSSAASLEASQQRTRATKCFGTCEDPACMRTCVEEYLSARPSSAKEGTTRDAVFADRPETSLIQCTLTALGDVGTCADVFLVPGEEDSEGFWVCVGGAGSKLLNCAGVSAAASGTPQTQVEFSLRLIIETAVDVVKTNNRVDRTLWPSRGGRNASGPAPLAQDAPVAAVTFRNCANDLKEDRGTCDDIFGGDADGSKVCRDGATLRFTNCVNSLQ